ncbi:MAG: DUF6089 family protein [Bacteroidota bacterium]
MKKAIVLLISMLLITGMANAQYKKHYGNKSWKKDRNQIMFGMGASNFLGELGGSNRIGSGTVSLRDMDMPSTRPDFHIGYRYLLSNNFALRGMFNYAWIGGNDKYTKELFRQNRNLNFRTPIYELSCMVEYYLNFGAKGHKYKRPGLKGSKSFSFSPYIFAGVGGIYFNPETKYKDRWWDLQPLGTEGQGLVPTRTKYSLYQVVLPYGLGVRFDIDKNWAIGVEYGMRWTFTDYLDDVSTTYFDAEALRLNRGVYAADIANPSPSNVVGDPMWGSTQPSQQRGDPTQNDTYVLGLITVYYTLNKGFIPKLTF